MAKLGLARAMRRAPSATERLLWRLLRDRRLADLKFRRQVPIGPYVVDFLCLRHRLIVEADGPFHDDARDAARDTWLRSQGFRVLRFANANVRDWRDDVLRTVIEAIDGPGLETPLPKRVVQKTAP